jgi:hypothetical protein
VNVVEESKEEDEVEVESETRCYIINGKKESACAAAKKMSSELPKLRGSN